MPHRKDAKNVGEAEACIFVADLCALYAFAVKLFSFHRGERPAGSKRTIARPSSAKRGSGFHAWPYTTS
jgi:hypothetical protein